MSFVAPTNPRLIGLSKDQLIIKRVCQKHFDEEGKRLRYAYACLFTDEETARGEPLLAHRVVHAVLIEHSYSKEQDDDEELSGAVLVIGKLGEDLHEHPTCSLSEADTIQIDKRGDVATDQPPYSFIKNSKKPVELEHTDAATDKPSCSFTKHMEKHVELKLELVVTVPTKFLKNMLRLQIHNWCKTVNKILKGDVEEKFVTKMSQPQKLALLKYKTLRLRKKGIAVNK